MTLSQTSPSTPSSAIQISLLPSPHPLGSQTKQHHHPNGGFQNPWPSYRPLDRKQAFQTRFGSHPEKNFVPVPSPDDHGARSTELVRIRRPDWGASRVDNLRATWIGHASFLIEFPVDRTRIDKTHIDKTHIDKTHNDKSHVDEIRVDASRVEEKPSHDETRGVRILVDPVWSERTSPVSFVGPKRYSPTPCALSEIPEVDVVCISHNHYDHLDRHTIAELFARRGDSLVFLVPMGDVAWFRDVIGVSEDRSFELDWWDRRRIEIAGCGEVDVTCCPAQHGSGRGLFDQNRSLWCSWAFEGVGKKLYFAGDTGYQAVGTPSVNPVFAEIGEKLGPFSLALLPIGLCTPASFMGSVHATPEQSLEIHKEVRARLSIGMHYGTVRGGISAYYEDVRDPPRRWREAAEKQELWGGGGVEGDGGSVVVDESRTVVGLLDIGETVAV